jgi:hypothetical protein
VPVTGELWTAVFGKDGMPIFKSPEFEGAKNRDGDLHGNGILVDHEKPKAVCFYMNPLNQHGEIVGLVRYGSYKIKFLLSEITDIYNDDLNTMSYYLS